MADSENHHTSYSEDEYGQIDREALLPAHGTRNALLLGIAGGLLAVGISVSIILLNTSIFREAGRLGDKMPYEIASTITTLYCLRLFINLALAFATGYLVGRVAVRRVLGFMAGGIVIAITLVSGFILNTIPGYPERFTAAPTPTTTLDPGQLLQGYLIIAAFIGLQILIGALIGLWGTTIVAKKHPYYTMQNEE